MLELAAGSYHFDKASCRLIADTREINKQIYVFMKHDKPYVLRLVNSPACYLNQTKAEMDWLLYLVNKGVTVPSPLKTENGEFAFSAEANGETYIISAFSMLNGQHWDKNNPNLWNQDVFYNWGKTVGNMHCLTRDYIPPNDKEKRCEFPIRGMISDNIKSFPPVNQIAADLLDEIEALPKDKDSYGLIHNDLHPGNFLIDGGRIHLIDFDDCAYSWYVFDIANALYLALWLGRSNAAGAYFANDIIRYFLKGYLSVNHLNEFWLSRIPLFMMSCKIALFSYGCDSENPNQAYKEESRKEQIYNIENNVLFTGCEIDMKLFQNH